MAHIVMATPDDIVLAEALHLSPASCFALGLTPAQVRQLCAAGPPPYRRVVFEMQFLVGYPLEVIENHVTALYEVVENSFPISIASWKEWKAEKSVWEILFGTAARFPGVEPPMLWPPQTSSGWMAAMAGWRDYQQWYNPMMNEWLRQVEVDVRRMRINGESARE